MAKRVLGVLAGDTVDIERIRAWAASSDLLLAADGGADTLLRSGFTPSFTVGDLDSLSDEARLVLSPIEANEDQNSSDCDKLLALCGRLGHRSITLVGSEGSRVDHMLASLQSAAASGLQVSFGYRAQWARVLRGPHTFSMRHEGLLSILPLTECRGCSLAGVSWPFHEAGLDALTFTSLSNQAHGEVHFSIQAGAAALFVPSEGEPSWLDGSAETEG